MTVRGWSAEQEARTIRKIVELHDVHGLSFRAIGDRYGIHKGIAADLYRRGKAQSSETTQGGPP